MLGYKCKEVLKCHEIFDLQSSIHYIFILLHLQQEGPMSPNHPNNFP